MRYDEEAYEESQPHPNVMPWLVAWCIVGSVVWIGVLVFFLVTLP